jgi:hypothetical protein
MRKRGKPYEGLRAEQAVRGNGAGAPRCLQLMKDDNPERDIRYRQRRVIRRRSKSAPLHNALANFAAVA